MRKQAKKAHSSITPAGENLAQVLIEMNEELKKKQMKNNHLIEDDPSKRTLEYNFEFGDRRFAFAKSSLFMFSDKNPVRVFLVRIFTHP